MPPIPASRRRAGGRSPRAEVVDPLTVKLTLDKPFVALIPFLADSFSSIICDSNKGVQGFGTTAAIGSGPWKLTSWTKGDKIVLAKNAGLQELRQARREQGRAVHGRAGHHDGARAAGAARRPEDRAQSRSPSRRSTTCRRSRNRASSTSSSPRTPVRTCSGSSRPTGRPSTTSAPARRSAYATDAAAAIDLVYGDLSIPEACPISRGVFGNDQDFCAEHTASRTIPTKAKALLAELGYGPDKPLEVDADRLDRRQARQARRGLPDPARRGRHQGEDRDHGHRHDECACPPGEREADRHRHAWI